MYFREHPPPPFRAQYGEHEAVMAIETGEVLEGESPGRALRLVREWHHIHAHELRANWDRARSHEQPVEIEPLT